jgi:hypothetical protein
MTADDDPILTAQEKRAAAALHRALSDTSEEWPVHLDAATWVATTSRRRSVVARLPVGLAAALIVVLLGVVAISSRPAATGPLSSPTSRPGHFDNGTFSFDYPTTWQILSSSHPVVLGTGRWWIGCEGDPSATGCQEAQTDITGGTIVLTIGDNSGGPPGFCSAASTFGPGSITKYTEDSLHATQPTTRWQIDRPGFGPGLTGNLWIDAVTDNPDELASAQKLVDSFRWDPAADWCSSETPGATVPGSAGHYDNGTLSFDYPTYWGVISGGYEEGMAFHVYGILGNGGFYTGCRIVDNGAECLSDKYDLSGGRVVVKIWTRDGGPAPACEDGTYPPNATLGANAVEQTVGPSSVTWEIRQPGANFTFPGNLIVEVHTDNPAELANARALVASFRWAPGASYPGNNCAPLETPTPLSTPHAG